MSNFYLGRTSDGRIVSRKSNRSDFTHAAITTDGRHHSLPNFSTSAEGARANFASSHRPGAPCEVVQLRKVDSKEFRAAMKGIDPHTGKARA